MKNEVNELAASTFEEHIDSLRSEALDLAARLTDEQIVEIFRSLNLKC